MKITDKTTTYQVAELMGAGADELDGRMLLGLLSRECIVDTDDLSEAAWHALLEEVCEIRRREFESGL